MFQSSRHFRNTNNPRSRCVQISGVLLYIRFRSRLSHCRLCSEEAVSIKNAYTNSKACNISGLKPIQSFFQIFFFVKKGDLPIWQHNHYFLRVLFWPVLSNKDVITENTYANKVKKALYFALCNFCNDLELNTGLKYILCIQLHIPQIDYGGSSLCCSFNLFNIFDRLKSLSAVADTLFYQEFSI